MVGNLRVGEFSDPTSINPLGMFFAVKGEPLALSPNRLQTCKNFNTLARIAAAAVNRFADAGLELTSKTNQDLPRAN